MEIAVGSFLYANADPVGMVDPTGRVSIGSLGVSLGISAALSGTINGFISFRSGASFGGVARSILIGAVQGAAWAVIGGAAVWAVRLAWAGSKGLGIAVTALRFGRIPLVGFKSPIAPYHALQAVTKGHRGSLQAHHILEARHLRAWGASARQVREVPAQVLSRQEHVAITAALRRALPFGVRYSRGQVWRAYERVYAQYPSYLRSISHYFSSTGF